MTEPTSISTTAKSSLRFSMTSIVLALLVVVMAVLLWRGFGAGRMEVQSPDNQLQTGSALEQRLLVAEQNLARLEQERQNLQQRLNESGQRTNLLRDEVLGIGERAALMEDNVRALSQNNRSAQTDLRLNEAELLLLIARERWQLSGDLAGTLQATELAALAVSGLKDAQWLNLRQALAQELAALRAIESDPRAIARSELDALEALLPQLSDAPTGQSMTSGERGLTRLLHSLIRIEPSNRQALISPAERQAARTALALEMANARFALQLRQDHEYKRSVLRIQHWLSRLYASTTALNARREGLLASANAPLSISVPLAGSSLLELQRIKNSGAP
jgi:uroporphyrin-III C-methyltransferase